jgi:hypothetical protein
MLGLLLGEVLGETLGKTLGKTLGLVLGKALGKRAINLFVMKHSQSNGTCVKQACAPNKIRPIHV